MTARDVPWGGRSAPLGVLPVLHREDGFLLVTGASGASDDARPGAMPAGRSGLLVADAEISADQELDDPALAAARWRQVEKIVAAPCKPDAGPSGGQ